MTIRLADTSISGLNRPVERDINLVLAAAGSRIKSGAPPASQIESDQAHHPAVPGFDPAAGQFLGEGTHPPPGGRRPRHARKFPGRPRPRPRRSFPRPGVSGCGRFYKGRGIRTSLLAEGIVILQKDSKKKPCSPGEASMTALTSPRRPCAFGRIPSQSFHGKAIFSIISRL